MNQELSNSPINTANECNAMANKAKEFLKAKCIPEAQASIQEGLEKFPNNVNLLTIASDVYRASGERDRSVDYAYLLISHQPDSWNGYGRAAQDLAALKRLNEAQEKVQEGLQKFPNQVNLLRIASDIYRLSRDLEMSLEVADLLITHDPDNWYGYGRAAQYRVSLKRFDEAQAKIQQGLQKIPNQLNLLKIASDTYRSSGSYSKSLEFAELLITHHPDDWNGYGRAAQDLVALKRFGEAQAKIQQGLQKIPNEPQLIKLDAYTSAYNGQPRLEMNDIEVKECALTTGDLISYSKVPQFFKLLQSKREKIKEGITFPKSLLFVGGLGRSGTTALGGMLNISSNLEMYTELYPIRINGYTPDDFSSETIAHKLKLFPYLINTNTFKRNQTSVCLGDKRPGFQFCLESTYDNFPLGKVKTIFIDRYLVDVCRSFHKRAENIKDTSWPMQNGIEHAVLVYNASCRQVIHLHDNRKEIMNEIYFANYEEVFTNLDSATKLFNFASLDLNEQESLQLQQYIDKSREIASKDRGTNSDLDKLICSKIKELLDYESHQRFCEITGIFRDYSFVGN
jgi:tetratricopeptide (TPR) repeat protein